MGKHKNHYSRDNNPIYSLLAPDACVGTATMGHNMAMEQFQLRGYHFFLNYNVTGPD